MNPYSSDFLDELAKQDELDDNGFLKFQQDNPEESLSEEVSQNVEEDSATPIFPKQIKSVPIPAYNEEFLNTLQGNNPNTPSMSMAQPKQLESQASVLEQSPEIDKWTQILESLKQPKPELGETEDNGNLSKSLITGLMGVNKGLETAMGSYGAKIADNSGVFKQAIDNVDKPIERQQKEQENLRKYLLMMKKAEQQKDQRRFRPEIRDYQMKDGSIRPFKFEDGQLKTLEGEIVSSDMIQRGFAKRMYEDVRTGEHRLFDPATTQTRDLGSSTTNIQEATSPNETSKVKIMNQTQKKDLESSRQHMPGDVKDFRDKLSNTRAIDELHKLMGQGNSIAAASFSGLYTRLFEKGVLTDKDVTRYVTSPRLAQGVSDWIKKKFEGTPSNITQQELKTVLNAISSAYHYKINEYTVKEAQRLKKQWKRLGFADNMSMLEVAQDLDPRFEIPPMVFSTLKQIQEERQKLKQEGKDPNNISEPLRAAYSKIKQDGYLDFISKKQ